MAKRAFYFLFFLWLILVPSKYSSSNTHFTPVKPEQKVNQKKTVTATISADILEYNLSENIYHLTGNVVIVYDKTILQANYVQYNDETSLAKAIGDVVLEDPQSTIHAHSALLYMDTKTGNIVKAKIFLKKDNYHIESDVLIKQGDKEYYAEEASITTCDSIIPAWCIKAKKADILVDKKIKAKDITFRIRGLPVLYAPFFSSSFGRKTGFLTPGFGFRGDKGAYINIPYFWAISKNRDMTFSVDSYSKRGFGQGIEYRYIESQRTRGHWWVYHFHDRDLDTNFIEVKSRHKQFNPQGFSATVEINYLNEKEFYKVYSPNIEEYMERYLESNIDLYYKKDWMRAYLLTQYWVDLEEDTGRISQKLPEVGFVLNPTEVGFIDKFHFSGSVANFYSEHGIKGERLDLFPGLTHTIGDSLRLTQRLGNRLTLYSLSGISLKDRSTMNVAIDYKASVDVTASKSYGSYTHVVEPSVSYSYISEDNNAPVLDQLENFDRESLLELAIMNYLRDEKGDFLYLRIANPYETNAPDRSFRQFRFQAGLLRPVAIKAEALYDYDENEIESANSEMSVAYNEMSANFGQRYNQKEDLLFLTGGLGVSLLKSVDVHTNVWYDTKEDDLRNLGIDLNYKKQCWGASVLYRKNLEDYGLYFMFELQGLGAYKFSGI